MNFEQRTQLEDLTKVKLGYTEEIRSCVKCKHATFDGGYNTYCGFSNICSFKVREHAYCDKFVAKEPDND